MVCNSVQHRKSLTSEFITKEKIPLWITTCEEKLFVLTFHGIFEEEVINVADGFPISALAAQTHDSLHQVINHFADIVGEDCHITWTHDELSEHTPHPQPVFAFTKGQNTGCETVAFGYMVRKQNKKNG